MKTQAFLFEVPNCVCYTHSHIQHVLVLVIYLFFSPIIWNYFLIIHTMPLFSIPMCTAYRLFQWEQFVDSNMLFILQKISFISWYTGKKNLVMIFLQTSLGIRKKMITCIHGKLNQILIYSCCENSSA